MKYYNSKKYNEAMASEAFERNWAAYREAKLRNNEARDKKNKEKYAEYAKELQRLQALDEKLKAEHPGEDICLHTCYLHRSKMVFQKYGSCNYVKYYKQCNGVIGQPCICKATRIPSVGKCYYNGNVQLQFLPEENKG